jgi:3-hydroxyisobutyrate dehydrogenase-like beta-hydroxyacid dehydrogenase
VGYDIDRSRLEALAALGGRPAESVAEVGRLCGRIVLAVFNTDQVEEVIESSGGLLSVPAPAGDPRIVINLSTCIPERIIALRERTRARGLAFVEMPISGTTVQIAKGDGVGLMGGDRTVLQSVDTIVATICPRRHFVGDIGSGGKAKLAINLILGLNRAALAEGIVLAEKIGLDPHSFLEVARGSAAYSQVMDVKGERMITRDFVAYGKIIQSLKDFTIICQSAAAAGQQLPFAELYLEMMRGCIQAGEGDWDNCAIVEEIRRRTPPQASSATR